jgi:hypothetical protein
MSNVTRAAVVGAALATVLAGSQLVAVAPAAAGGPMYWQTRVVGQEPYSDTNSAVLVSEYDPDKAGNTAPDPGFSKTITNSWTLGTTNTLSASSALEFTHKATINGGGNLAPLGVGIDVGASGEAGSRAAGSLTYTATSSSSVTATVTTTVSQAAKTRPWTGHRVSIYPIGVRYHIEQRRCLAVPFGDGPNQESNDLCGDWQKAGNIDVPTGVGIIDTVLGLTQTAYTGVGRALWKSSVTPDLVGKPICVIPDATAIGVDLLASDYEITCTGYGAYPIYQAQGKLKLVSHVSGYNANWDSFVVQFTTGVAKGGKVRVDREQCGANCGTARAFTMTGQGPIPLSGAGTFTTVDLAG